MSKFKPIMDGSRALVAVLASFSRAFSRAASDRPVLRLAGACLPGAVGWMCWEER